jgi:threonine/homoserine/homoserine lactone efflux protein
MELPYMDIVIPNATSIGIFSVAAILLLLTPGPAVLYIVARSVEQGRIAGLASVCGITTGTLVHVLAAALGLFHRGALGLLPLRSSDFLLELVKIFFWCRLS